MSNQLSKSGKTTTKNKTMKTKYIQIVTLAAITVAATILSSGCISSSKATTTPASTESTGQQLIDLKKAYTDGDITKEQYEKLQKKLVNKND